MYSTVLEIFFFFFLFHIFSRAVRRGGSSLPTSKFFPAPATYSKLFSYLRGSKKIQKKIKKIVQL